MRVSYLLSAFVILIIAQSCLKSTDDLTTMKFSVEEAQIAFVNHFNNALATKSANEVYYSLAGGDYTPIWERAKSNENEYIWSLEVPIISNLQIVLKNRSTEVVTAVERRLLFIKNKQTNEVSSFIMVSSAAETKASTSGFEHLAENASYTGYVLYSTLAGEFVNLCSYNNGVLVANIDAISASSAHHHDCDSEECSNNDGSNVIEDVLEGNEYGIMPMGMGGEYFEGFCIYCGAPEPECWCLNSCSICGGYPCICDDHVCFICGKTDSNCTCAKFMCSVCRKFIDECVCEREHEFFCEECGNYHENGKCKMVCPRCGKFISKCECK